MTQLAAIARRWSAAAAPRATIPPQEWCEKVRRMKNGARFRWSYAPYLLKIFLSFYDRYVLETVLEMFSRAGKSEIILNWIGEGIDQNPGNYLYSWPTVGQAEKFSKDNLTGELFDETPCLNHLGSSSKSRFSGNTILHKQFTGGRITMFGMNSPGEMRRAKGNRLAGDEIDAVEETETDEGDPLAIFSKRGDEYPDVTRIWASYPSVLGRSRIHAKMLRSDFQQYFVTCVICGGEPFVMHRRQLQFDEDRPQDARLMCPRCQNLLTDPQRHSMMLQGRENDCWRPTQEFRGVRGFHANSLLWPHRVDPKKFPGGFLEMLARKMIDAERSDNPQRAKRIIVNADDAEPFDPQAADEKPPEWKPLFDRRESYTGVPAGGLVITGAADLQLNRIEVEWKAWGRNEESWGLGHVVIDGDVRDVGVWDLFLRELRGRKFVHASGAEMEFSLFFVDGGFWSEWLFQFLAKLSREPVAGVSGKVRATKGVGASPHPIVTDWRSIAKNLKGYHVGTWQVKEVVNRRLLMQPSPDGALPEGWMHWNEGYSEEYFRQLCTAKATVDFKNGEEIRTYPGEHGVRDEALDLNVYNYAAFRRRRWDFDAIEADLKARAKALKTGQTVQKDEEPTPIQPRSPFARGWSL